MVCFYSHFLAGLKNIFPGCQNRNITFSEIRSLIPRKKSPRPNQEINSRSRFYPARPSYYNWGLAITDETQWPLLEMNIMSLFQPGESPYSTRKRWFLLFSFALLVFFEPGGTLSTKIMPNGLHLSPTGYQRWATAIEPHLEKLGF